MFTAELFSCSDRLMYKTFKKKS